MFTITCKPAILVLAIALSLTNTVKSQSASGSSNAFATIVIPLTIAKNQDLDFGNIDHSNMAGGDIILSPDGVCSGTKGRSVSSGTITAADFTIMGGQDCTFSINLPGSLCLSGSSGLQWMLATAFTASPSTATLTGGSIHIKIGATLSLAPEQLPGRYSSQSFEVMVNYN